MKSSIQYVRTLLATGIFLLFATLNAQSAVKLTNFDVRVVGETYVEQLYAHDGLIYTANRPQDDAGVGRFGVIDVESGAFVALADPNEYRGGYIPERYSGAFQEIDGLLFGTTFGFGIGYEIYRLDGTTVTRLTRLAGAPLTELVAYNDAYYFLVRGGADGLSADGRASAYQTELWKTDGTAAGTVKEADLPILNNGQLGENPATLIAGETALLIGGKALDQAVSGFQTLFLYRSGEGATEVRTEPNAEYDRATLYSEFIAEGRNAYFAGGFYLAGLPFGDSDFRESVFRIDEGEGILRRIPALRSVSFETYLEYEVSFVATEDRLYTHIAGAEAGYALYSTTADSPLFFDLVSSVEEPSARISLKLYNGNLYFGGSLFGQPALLSYNIAGRFGGRLFRTGQDPFLAFTALLAEDVVYLVPVDGSDVVYRYRLNSGALTTFDNFQTSSFGRADYLATLRGNDLVYLGAATAAQAGYTAPFVLEREADAPRIIADLGGGEQPVGAYATLGRLPGGEILFAALPNAGGSVYHVYDPASASVRQLNPPEGLADASLEYAGEFSGLQVFSAYSAADERYALYIPSTEGFVPLTDQAGGEQASTGELTSFLETGVIIDRDGFNYEVYDYDVSADRVTRRQIASGSSDEISARRYGEFLAVTATNGQENTTTVYAEDRTESYTFQYSTSRQLLSANAEGYFLLDFLPGSTATLEYGTASTPGGVQIPFPEGITPEINGETVQLGSKLLLSPYNLTRGGEYFVADGTAGTFELLADIFPGTGGSLGGARLEHGGILYFSANDGVTGTELWRTDGTPGGTYLLSDVFEGPDYSDPTEFYVYEGSLYFRARGAAGTQVYSLELGGQAAPVRLTDINPADGGAQPYDFVGAETGLYFLARPAAAEAFQLYQLSEPSTSTNADPLVHTTVRVYPNPVAHRLIVEATDGERIQSVDLFDGNGRKLLTTPPTNGRHELAVSHLPRGSYFVRVSYPTGRSVTRSIVVAR